MPYIESPTTYDFPVTWDGSNTEEVVRVISEWGASVFQDDQFSAYVTVGSATSEDNLFLVHPGATMLAIVTKGQRIRLPYKKGKPFGPPPIISVTEEDIAGQYDEEVSE